MKANALLACIAVALAACATGPEPKQQPEQLRATHGFVRVTIPSGAISGPVIFEPLRGGGDRYLQAHPELGANVLGAWLPAGDYQISDLLQANGSQYPPIHVESGRITEMGALIDVQLGGYEFMRIAFAHPEAKAQLQEAVKKLRPHLATTEVLEWSMPATPKVQQLKNPPTGLGLIADLISLYERNVNEPPIQQRIKEATSVDSIYHLALTSMPPRTDEPGVDAAGSLYYGADLGQVRVRNGDGHWSALDTGTLQAITAVEASAGRLVVGTASGEIRASGDGGISWQKIAAVDATESVVDIDRIDGRWIVISAVTAPLVPTVEITKRWKVYSSVRDDMSELSLIRDTTVPDAAEFASRVGIRGQAAGHDTYYINALTELQKLDLRTMQWAAIKPPQSLITHFSLSNDGAVLTVFLARGGFSKLSVSPDQGATWQSPDRPSYQVKGIHFETMKIAHATRTEVSAFSSRFQFLNYDPVADGWVKAYEAPAGCTQLLRGVDNLQRFCLTSGGSILDYSNGKWVVEFAAN